MRTLFFAFCLIAINLASTLPAMAEPQYKKGYPFEIKGFMTHFYGRQKSAESDMWAQALQVCHNLSEGENNGLLLNRLSDVEFATEHSNMSSTAQATFICLTVGAAD